MLLLLAAATAPVAIVLTLYGRWWWAGGRGPDCEPLPLGWRVAALAQEVVALTIAVVRSLQRRLSSDSHAPAEAPDIVLLAGGALGEAALAPLLDRLAASAWTTILFRPTSWRLPVADAAAQLDTFLRRYTHRPGIVLIAYGATGLILRYYLRRYPATGIRRVVTIGTPHQGTAAAPVAFEPAPQPALDAMRRLAAGDRVPLQFDVIAIHSDFDELIAPAARAYYPGAFNIQVRGVGRFALARSQRLFELLTENLDPPPARVAVPHQTRCSSITASTRAKS